MQVKPGYKTTEFWLSLLGVAFAGLVLYGVVTQQDADTIISIVRDLLFGGGALTAITAIVRFYIDQRGALKIAEKDKS